MTSKEIDQGLNETWMQADGHMCLKQFDLAKESVFLCCDPSSVKTIQRRRQMME